MTIRHGSGSYEVRFLSIKDALGDLPDSSFVVTDSNVREHFAGALPSACPVYSVTPGEISKSTEVYLRVIDWLALIRRSAQLGGSGSPWRWRSG